MVLRYSKLNNKASQKETENNPEIFSEIMKECMENVKAGRPK